MSNVRRLVPMLSCCLIVTAASAGRAVGQLTPPEFISPTDNGTLSFAPNSTTEVQVRVNFHDYGPYLVQIVSDDESADYGTTNEFTSELLNGSTLIYSCKIKLKVRNFTNAKIIATGMRSTMPPDMPKVTVTGISSPP